MLVHIEDVCCNDVWRTIICQTPLAPSQHEDRVFPCIQISNIKIRRSSDSLKECLKMLDLCLILKTIENHVHLFWIMLVIPISTLRWRHNDHAGVSNHQPHSCLLNRLFRRKSKKTSKLRVTGLCAGNSPGTGEFPAQMASYAENVSIWWRHHELVTLLLEPQNPLPGPGCGKILVE